MISEKAALKIINSSRTDQIGNALYTLMLSCLKEHPLPWRIERDWPYEVKSLKDSVVAKFPNEAEAEAFIELANLILEVRSDVMAEANRSLKEWLKD